MNQVETRLYIAAKINLLSPLVLFLILLIGTRVIDKTLGWIAAAKFTETVFVAMICLPPVIGLLILLYSLFEAIKKRFRGLSSELLYSMIYSGLAVVSPVFMLLLWIALSGFMR